MIHLETVHHLLRYGDAANQQCLRASAKLADDALDRPFDMGRGTLRKTLIHLHAGEFVWLQRWRALTETPWPDEEQRVGVVALSEAFGRTVTERDAFLAGLTDADLTARVVYRDSFGGLFAASRGDMMLQMCVHSVHHRAQAVNMLRRLGTAPPELDYMMSIRQPA